jgi:hypothetical protein
MTAWRLVIPLLLAVLVSCLHRPYWLYALALIAVWLGARWFCERRRLWFEVGRREV